MIDLSEIRERDARVSQIFFNIRAKSNFVIELQDRQVLLAEVDRMTAEMDAMKASLERIATLDCATGSLELALTDVAAEAIAALAKHRMWAESSEIQASI